MGILDNFSVLLESKQTEIRREIYWALSNILAAKASFALKTFEHKVYEKILNYFKNEIYTVKLQNYIFFKIVQNKREIIYCLTNTITTSNDLAEKLLDRGVIEIFNEIIDFGEFKMVMLILEAIEKILFIAETETDPERKKRTFLKISRSKIPEILHQLENNQSQQIFDFAGNIIHTYFKNEPVQNYNDLLN